MVAKRVLIVGGGTAGWITAAYMDAVLNSKSRKVVDITLVESAAIGRIGVGEATVPTLRDTLRTIGVSETDVMKHCDATFKQAIKFVNWERNEGESYYHPFDRRQTGRFDRAGLKWLNSQGDKPFAEMVSIQPTLCDENYSPKLMENNPEYTGPLAYAYHVDAEKLADYLRDVAVSRGVVHITDDVIDVSQSENGDIESVATRNHGKLEADLFVDCTGFAALMIGKTLDVEHIDYKQWLLCDSAVPMRVPYDAHDPSKRLPYTLSTALSSGWAWDINLADRRGTGYVFSSQFIDDESAIAELRAFEGEHAKELDARVLRFRVGRRARCWERNCVAIGLSSGFIEPLESTGIYLIELQAAMLCEHFPFAGRDGDVMQPLADRFNDIIQQRYEEILDLIVLHYCLTKRNDTAFWREVQKTEHIHERLQQRLALWQQKLPSSADCRDSLQLFSHHTFEYIMYGMNFMRDRSGVTERLPAEIPADISRALQTARAKLPNHDVWLQAKLGEGYQRFANQL